MIPCFLSRKLLSSSTGPAVVVLKTQLGALEYQRVQSRSLMGSISKGIKYWKEKKEKDTDPVDIRLLSKELLKNLEVSKRGKCHQLLKIFDNVETKEDLKVAEEALLAFRKGYNLPTPALPMVVVRACIRLDLLDKALDIANQKVEYGVFPSVKVYNVIMDTFLAKKSFKNIVKTYNQMLADELKPDITSYRLAVFGYILLGTDKGYENAVRLSLECLSRFPDHRNSMRPYHSVLYICIKRGRPERVRKIMEDLSKYPLKNKFDIGYRTRGYIHVKEYDSALSLLSSLTDKSQSLLLRQGFLDEFTDVLKSEEKEEELQRLKEIVGVLQSNGQIETKNPSGNETEGAETNNVSERSEEQQH